MCSVSGSSARQMPGGVAPPPQRVSRLRTLDDVRVELARVYREARTRKLPLDQAKGLAYLLQVMSGLIKETELERRVAALEGVTGESPR
jgi:hypothetical protein